MSRSCEKNKQNKVRFSIKKLENLGYCRLKFKNSLMLKNAESVFMELCKCI